MRIGTVVLAAFLVALPVRAGAAAGPETVEVPSGDGRTLAGEWYPALEGRPGLVVLVGPGAPRDSWKPLVEARPPGWGVLVVDLKTEPPPLPPLPPGKPGAPSPKPPAKGKGKEPPPIPLLVRLADQAVSAARWVREGGRCDVARVGFAGAGAFAVVALEAGVRDGKAAGVLALAPVFETPGFAPADRGAAWGAVPLLVAATETDAGKGGRALVESLKDRPGAELRIYPGKECPGTELLGRGDAVEQDLSSWIQVWLGRQILDGHVDQVEEQNGGSTDLPGVRVIGPRGGAPVHVRLDSRFINFSYVGREGDPLSPKVAVTLAVPVDDNGARVEVKVTLWADAGADGTMGKPFMSGQMPGKTRAPGSLVPMPDTAIAATNVIEGRLPWSLFGATPTDGMSLHFRWETDKSTTTVMIQGALGKKR